MKRLILGWCLSLMLPTAAGAVMPKTVETAWTQQSYSSFTSHASSTHVVTGIGFSYAIYSVGSNVEYTIAQTTRTYSPSLGYAPTRSTSTLHLVPAGIPLNGKFKALTVDPAIVIHNFDTSATTYLYIEYGKRKVQ